MDATAATALETRPVARALGRLLNDPRDFPFLGLMAQCALIASCGIALFFVPEYFWYLAVLYLAAVATCVDRFILMLHCTSHRALFKKRYGWANQLIPRVLGPFFGETPESYFVHHMGMHHPENNLHQDRSSTLTFRRDSLPEWLRYWGRFMVMGLFDLGRYHASKGNKKMLRRMILGEAAFWLGVTALLLIHWQAALVVFVVPVLVVRTLMMAGNWAQHAFIDPRDPNNPYWNSITCINTRYNRRCFNDGYHIHHHVKARTHWSEMPAEFQQNRAVYGQHDAVVFDGIDFFQVWLLLMGGRWQRLAKHFVALPGAPERTEDEIIRFLKSRTQPLPDSA